MHEPLTVHFLSSSPFTVGISGILSYFQYPVGPLQTGVSKGTSFTHPSCMMDASLVPAEKGEGFVYSTPLAVCRNQASSLKPALSSQGDTILVSFAN